MADIISSGDSPGQTDKQENVRQGMSSTQNITLSLPGGYNFGRLRATRQYVHNKIKSAINKYGTIVRNEKQQFFPTIFQ